jgi:hypothetical protein
MQYTNVFTELFFIKTRFVTYFILHINVFNCGLYDGALAAIALISARVTHGHMVRAAHVQRWSVLVAAAKVSN